MNCKLSRGRFVWIGQCQKIKIVQTIKEKLCENQVKRNKILQNGKYSIIIFNKYKNYFLKTLGDYVESARNRVESVQYDSAKAQPLLK